MKLAAIIPFLFYLSLCQAQRFHAGPVAGISTSQVHGDTYSGFDKAGLMAGCFVNRHLSRKLQWQMEILYIQKGSRKTARPDKGDYQSYLLRLNYIEVPLMLRYHFRTADSTGDHSARFALEAGAAFGSLVHSEEHDAFGLVPSGGIPFEKQEYSMFLGLNYFITDKLSVNARSENSVVPVRIFSKPAYYPNFVLNLFNRGMYNNVLSFSLRFQF